MTLDVTVITPTIPGREEMLAEAKASVVAQALPVAAHLVRFGDVGEWGPNPLDLAHKRNALAELAVTDWVACLDDDDLYLPEHFATIAPYLDDEADVIYTWPTERVVATVDVTGWSSSFIAHELQRSNLIPSNACIRRAALEKVGGWEERYDLIARQFPSGCAYEDWDLWLRMAQAGMRFRCVPAMTWVYRRHDNNLSDRWCE